jgi:hypothetical protein
MATMSSHPCLSNRNGWYSLMLENVVSLSHWLTGSTVIQRMIYYSYPMLRLQWDEPAK